MILTNHVALTIHFTKIFVIEAGHEIIFSLNNINSARNKCVSNLNIEINLALKI